MDDEPFYWSYVSALESYNVLLDVNVIDVRECGVQQPRRWWRHQDEGFEQGTKVDLALALSYVVWEDGMRSPWAKKMDESYHLPKVGHRDVKTL